MVSSPAPLAASAGHISISLVAQQVASFRFAFSSYFPTVKSYLHVACPSPASCMPSSCLISQSTWSLTFPFSFPCESCSSSRGPGTAPKCPAPFRLQPPFCVPRTTPPPSAHSHLHSHQSGSHRHEHCRQDAQIFIGSREFFISTVAGRQAGVRGGWRCVCLCVGECASARVRPTVGGSPTRLRSRAASPRLALLRVAASSMFSCCCCCCCLRLSADR